MILACSSTLSPTAKRRATHRRPPPNLRARSRTFEDEITTLCAHISAAECRLLRAIGEFDARSGWAGIGIASCAHWLNWKCGISLVTAHERVRVARALRELPATGAAMGRGELSYSKVRAITRVATPENEATLVNLARKGTAHHLEETVRQYRKLRRTEETKTGAERQRGREVRYHWDDDGMLVIRARLPAEQGAVVLKALEAAAEALRGTTSSDFPSSFPAGNSDTSPTDESPAGNAPRAHALDKTPFPAETCFVARRADALVLMSETLLAKGAEGLTPGEKHQVVVHVDAAVLADETRDGRAEIEGGPALAVDTVRRLLCDGSVVPVADDANGEPLNIGRKTRAIPPSLRRALKSRDGGCRFPGCTNRRWVDGHHIEHWADGGETKLANLVSMCSLHHRLVHEEGFKVERDTNGALSFRTPDGRRIDDAPSARVLAHDPVLALVGANTRHGACITPRTCVPEWFGERPDYNWLVGCLQRHDEFHRRPPPVGSGFQK